MAKRPYIPVKPVSEATTGEQITAFMFGLLVPSTALAIVALYIKSRFPKTGLFSWSLDQVEDRFLLGTVGLMLACVVLSIAFSISRKVLPFVMRQNALAKIRTKDRAEAKAHAARERERAAREAEHRLEQERREADRQRELAILTERTSWTNTANDLLAGTIADIFAVYRAATPEQRALIEHGYRERLAVAHPRSKYPTALPSVAALNHQARLLFLPAIIDADGSRQDYATLEFTGSDPAAARYLYTAHSGLPDVAHWEKAIPAINAYLGGSWRVERTGGAGIMLAALPAMQDTFPLVPAMLQHGEVYLGQNLNTGGREAVRLADLSHTLVAGPTGMGKSVLLHQLMASVVFNIDAFETVHLIDLKYGIELQDYAHLHPKFQLATEPAEMAQLTARLLALMDERGRLMRERRWQQWRGPLVLIVIDEFADVLLAEPDKKKREALETSLVRLTNLSRALGFRFWIQSQKTTADALPAAIRNNLQSVISFRMVTNQAAAMLFGGIEHLPADITTLKRGQAIYRDGRTSDTVAFQAALATFANVEAALLASAATANPPADYSA